MLAFLQRFLSAPHFAQDDEKTRAAAILSPLLLGTILLLIVLTIAQGFTGEKSYLTITTAILAILIMASIVLWFFVKRGYVRPAAIIYASLGWLALSFQAWADHGFRDTAIFGYVVIILISCILLGLGSGIAYLTISLVSCWVFAYLETIGKYSGLGDPPYRASITLTVFFVLVTVLSSLAVNNIQQALKKSQTGGQELKLNNNELQALQVDLEKRVAERTTELDNRISEIQTASLIARDTASAPDIDSLLDRAAQLIMEKFGYYHTGIYLIDDNGEYAVLRGAGGDAGRLLMKRKYKVTIKEPGIIGFVAQTGGSRTIKDVASEPAYLKNPLLPYTRSELALPLKVTNSVTGVLDIQSDKTNAFDQSSISILQIVTDQISIGIERGQLLQGLQQNALALQQALRENTSRTWRNFLEQNRGYVGYRYDGISIESLAEPSGDSRKVMQENTPIFSAKSESSKTSNTVAVPIQLRGQTLGTLNLQFQGTEIPPETLRLVEEAANRLALALENARLVQDAQRLATRERQINVISAQVQQSTNLETLLQNTVRELGNALGMPKTFIQIGLVNSGLKKD